MPAQKFHWDESSSGDGAGEWRYVMPRKKQARKTETVAVQDGKHTHSWLCVVCLSSRCRWSRAALAAAAGAHYVLMDIVCPVQPAGPRSGASSRCKRKRTTSRSASPTASWSRSTYSQNFLVKLGLVSPERPTRSTRPYRAGKPAGAPRPSGLAQHSDTTEFDLVGSCGEAGHSPSREIGTTSAADTAVAKLAGVARPPGWNDDEAGSSWSRAMGTSSAPFSAVAKSIGEKRPPGIAKHSATTEPVESSGGGGHSWSSEIGTTSAGVTVVTKAVGEALPPEFVDNNATSESEPAESSDEDSSSMENEAGSSWSRASCTTSTAATTALAKSVGEVRPPGLAKRRALTASEFALSSGLASRRTWLATCAVQFDSRPPHAVSERKKERG